MQLKSNRFLKSLFLIPAFLAIATSHAQGERAEDISILDVDGSGNVDAWTEGILLLRLMFGLTDEALASGVVDLTNCTECEPGGIESYISTIEGATYGGLSSSTVTTGPQGVGDTGDRGPVGATGADGATGLTGPAGAAGINGTFYPSTFTQDTDNGVEGFYSDEKILIGWTDNKIVLKDIGGDAAGVLRFITSNPLDGATGGYDGIYLAAASSDAANSGWGNSDDGLHVWSPTATDEAVAVMQYVEFNIRLTDMPSGENGGNYRLSFHYSKTSDNFCYVYVEKFG